LVCDWYEFELDIFWCISLISSKAGHIVEHIYYIEVTYPHSMLFRNRNLRWDCHVKMNLGFFSIDPNRRLMYLALPIFRSSRKFPSLACHVIVSIFLLHSYPPPATQPLRQRATAVSIVTRRYLNN
jgi:hypothetical protein